MMRRLLLAFALALAATTGAAREAAPPSRAEIAAEAESVAARYAAQQRELDAYEAQARALAEPGTALAAYRDLALRVLAVRDDIAATQRRLEDLHRLLGEMGPQLPAFEIIATQGTYDGPPVADAMANGAVIALRAVVPGAADADLLPTRLTWRLLRASGAPVPAYVKAEDVAAAGGETETRVRFLLRDLPEGAYAAALRHESLADPSVSHESAFAFDVLQPLAVERVWVTATAGDETGRDTLAPDERVHVYVAYRGRGPVRVALRVTHAASGALAFAHEWERAHEEGRRRTGLRLPEGTLEAGDRLVAEIVLADEAGETETARVGFAIGGGGGGLALRVPPRLADDELATFAIEVPEAFQPPFAVDVSAPGLTVALAGPGALHGTLHGRAIGADSRHQMRVTVTDAAGRRASARAHVTVAAKESPSAAPPSAPPGAAGTAPPVAAPPTPAPPSAAARSPAAAPPPADAPAGGPATSQAPEAAASRPPSAPTAAPAARAAQCRQRQAAYEGALRHANDLAGRLKAVHDALHQRFRGGYDDLRARLAAAGGERRADAALRAEAEKYRRYFALTKELAAMSDCGQVVYTLKNSWVGQTFAYPAEEATRLCLAYSDAARAASQARAAAAGCLTPAGELRPEVAEGRAAEKTPAREQPGPGGAPPRCLEVEVEVEAGRVVDGRTVDGRMSDGKLRFASLAPRCDAEDAAGTVREFPHATQVCGVTVMFDNAEVIAAIPAFAAAAKARGNTHLVVADGAQIIAHCPL